MPDKSINQVLASQSGKPKKRRHCSLPNMKFSPFEKEQRVDINQLSPLTFYGLHFKTDSSKIHTAEFKTDSLLGRGGYGEVFFSSRNDIKKSSNMPANQAKAFKIFIKKTDPEEAHVQLELIKKEHRIMEKAGHLKVRPLLEKNQYIIIVMNYLRGQDLFDIINNNRNGGLKLTEFQLLHITEQLLIQYNNQIAQHQLIHRDLKSENIRYDLKKGKLNYFDFGLALEAGDEDSNYVGSEFYMAPEILFSKDDGKKKKYTSACDIYALGKILVELWLRYIFCSAKPSLKDCFLNEPEQRPYPDNLEDLLKRSVMISGYKDLQFIIELASKMVCRKPEERFNIGQAIDFFNKHYSKISTLNQNQNPNRVASSSSSSSMSMFKRAEEDDDESLSSLSEYSDSEHSDSEYSDSESSDEAYSFQNP